MFVCIFSLLGTFEVQLWYLSQLNFQVFIPLALYLRVCKIFDCVRENKEKGFVSKEGSKIDYQKLALGALEEVRHVFARVVFDTIYLLKS